LSPQKEEKFESVQSENEEEILTHRKSFVRMEGR
jgi:hypothetical protein